jgi:hypothetical protein
MQTTIFSNSRLGQLRAQLHEIPYKANNALIERLKCSVGPPVAKKVDDILHEIPNRKKTLITDTFETARLHVGDIVHITLKTNATPHKPYTTPQLATLTLSVAHKTPSRVSIVSAYVFSQNHLSDSLVAQNSARLPHTLFSKIDRSWGKKSLAPSSNKIGKFEILSSDIQAITVHQIPLMQGIVNKFKRWYNIFLDLFKAETRISTTKER